MLLCQQRGIVPHDGKEVLENKGPINKGSIERITREKDTSILKEARKSKARKGKTNADTTLSQLSPSPLPEFPVFQPISQNYELSFADDDLEDQDRSMASSPIVQVSDNDKAEESKYIEECLQKIDSLFEDGIFVDQEDTVVEKEVVVEDEKEK
ncbi:hypothetical protein PVK06_004687 [Gossypium arboreum]|uniref:Uncharacterized protein n=1 Tax=Gossypium arboreum TaxID=29729 RepID=A0ABR0QTL8_GOSAR|nr:hypothetical protein PVK06_004687 [Gossypium arboreum]